MKIIQKKQIKILLIILLAVCMIFAVQHEIYGGSIVDPITDPGHYNPDGTMGATTKTTGIIQVIVKGVTVFGIGVSLVCIAVIGIKYITSSLEERAHYKETMVPYIIGLVLLLNISVILNILANIFYNIGV